jgi:hypothetical protein
MSLMIFWIGLSLAFGLGWVCRALLAPDALGVLLDAQRAELLRSLRELDAWLDERERRDQDWSGWRERRRSE